MENLLLVYNPMSGKKNTASLLDKITEIFSKAGKTLTLYRIGSSIGTVDELLQTDRFDGVVVCGGDGSVNKVVKSIINSGKDIPVGVLPNGTCNDFSRSLGMPGDILRCARLVAQGNTAKIDVGLINDDEIFVNELAGGVLVSVSFNTDQNMKKVFGPLAYYVNGIGELANIKPFKLKIETKDKCYEEDALVFLVLNGTDISGFSGVIKEAQMQDGSMNILVFKNTNPLALTDTLLKFVSGGNFKDENVLRIETSECKISTDADISITVDGEKGPDLPIKLVMKKQGIKVYC